MTEELKQAAEIQLVASIQFQTAAHDITSLMKALQSVSLVTAQSFRTLSVQINSIAKVFGNLGNSLTVAQQKFDLIDRFIPSISKIPGSKSSKTSLSPRNLKSIFTDLKIGLQANIAHLKRGGSKAVGGAAGSLLMQPFRPLTGILKNVGGGIKQMGKQMLKLNLAIRPATALMQGILEPLEPLIDIFGAFGEIIGMVLVPLMNAIMKVLLPILPLLVVAMQGLSWVIKILSKPIVWLGNVIGNLIETIMRWIGESKESRADARVDKMREKAGIVGFTVEGDQFAYTTGQGALQRAVNT